MIDSGYGKTIDDILLWVKFNKSITKVDIIEKPILNLDGWYFSDKGFLVHRSGKFFSIRGISVTTNFRSKDGENVWHQPIIFQEEVGVLGIIRKKINNVDYYLMQAKIEPGNINYVQISPTVQATKSNFTTVHKGKVPKFVEFFLEKKGMVVYDQLQSEQNSRFYKKRNRNIVLELKEEHIDIPHNFCWMTLKQIQLLLKKDNLVNMDTRTVISCLLSCIYEDDIFNKIDRSVHTIQEIINWLADLKFRYYLNINIVPLQNIDMWTFNGDFIKRYDNKYFSVIGGEVHIEGREVSKWDQPLIKPSSIGVCCVIVKNINGIDHFLVNAKLECGIFDLFELAPTFQMNNYLFLSEDSLYKNLLKFRHDVILKTLQSEEGGRFYQEENYNIIVRVYDDFSFEETELYKWVSVYQLLYLIKHNNILNIQLRSLLSFWEF